jgi:hypothetical protein
MGAAAFAGIGGAILQGWGRARGAREQAKDTIAMLNNQYLMDLMRQKQFKPLAPFTTAARAQMFAGIMKAWGMENLFGDEFFTRLKDAKIPGYNAPDFMPVSRRNLSDRRFGITGPGRFQFDVPRGPGYAGSIMESVGSYMAGGGMKGAFGKPPAGP